MVIDGMQVDIPPIEIHARFIAEARREDNPLSVNCTSMMQKYAIMVNGDNLDEAVEETAHLLYLLLGRSLRAHRRTHTEECGFEEFALEMLNALSRYRNAYSTDVILEPEIDELDD